MKYAKQAKEISELEAGNKDVNPSQLVTTLKVCGFILSQFWGSDQELSSRQPPRANLNYSQKKDRQNKNTRTFTYKYEGINEQKGDKSQATE